MATVVDVKSSRKGGNPGGKCTVKSNVGTFDAYYKFCYGSKINSPTSFKAGHQPVYEAVTFTLANILGLDTPQTYVLYNQNRDVVFSNWRNHVDTEAPHDPSGRPCYFVSKLVHQPMNHGIDPACINLLERHRPYLESLLIADIINIGQNYAFYKDASFGQGAIKFLDLGCSFVHAKQGFLLQPNKLRIREGDLSSYLKRLNKYHLLTVDDSLINIGQLIETIPKLFIPTLNTPTALHLNELLSNEEVLDIQKLVAQGFMDSFPLLTERDLIA